MVKGFDEDGNAVMSVATNAQGDEISASTTFTPTEKDGMVEVTFTVPAELYDNGSSIVVFETLLRGDVVIVSHEDPNDEDQTVVIAYPEIKTTMTRRLLLLIRMLASGTSSLMRTLCREQSIRSMESL